MQSERDWQCGTLQVDLNLPGRLGATFVDKDGSKTPVMLLQNTFGSIERFIGILIRTLCRQIAFMVVITQAVVLPISEENNSYAKKVFEDLFKEGIKCEVDLKNQKINYKIREHSLYEIPMLLICGKKSNPMTLSQLESWSSEKQETIKRSDFIKQMSKLNNYP